jgi:hypothetical protein
MHSLTSSKFQIQDEKAPTSLLLNGKAKKCYLGQTKILQLFFFFNSRNILKPYNEF